jgi:23S rRNA (uracil1939-C5)-methyltransferase
MVTSGEILALTVEKPAAGGAMIARVDGQVILVAGAIPGEHVRARVDRVGKGVAYATTVAVQEASPDRREPFCDPQCGGLLYNHIAYPRQLAIKGEVIADAFKRIGRLELPGRVEVAGSREDGYRMRARLHVRGHGVGFFREGTHDLCDVRATRQLLPATCDVIERLTAAMRSLGIDSVREIELSENVEASERAVYIDATGSIDARAIERLAATDGVTGLGSASGASGSPHVTDRLNVAEGLSVAFERHVQAFFQGNRYLLATLVRHVVTAAAAPGRVVDLYAGVGLFAVSVAAVHGVAVTAVEGDRYAAADLAANAVSAGVSVGTVHQSVETFVRGAGRRSSNGAIATLILDPPRTGLSKEALEGTLRLDAATLIYVSCDAATLARDARKIVDAGYAITRADGFDLFPNTPHVETVVVFHRATRVGAALSGPPFISAPPLLPEIPRTACGIRRCGKNSPDATGRRDRTFRPDLRSPR